MKPGPDGDVIRAKDGRGGFFAVDRRAWHLVSGLGLNPAVAYLVMARGTGGDNRTTKWSTNSIEKHTGIARSRCKAAVEALEKVGAVWRDPASKRDHPHYKLVPAHEVPSCEGFSPSALDAEHARVHEALGDGWTETPKSATASGAYQRWGSMAPRRVAEDLVKLGRVEAWRDGRHFRAIRYDAEAAARPDWIWLPNALVDGVAGEVPPVELVRQTHSLLTLRLLVNIYGAQVLDENGGIHFRRIRQEYKRHKVGERGSLVAWGFAPSTERAWSDASFIAGQFPTSSPPEPPDDAGKAAWAKFWACFGRLKNLGLVEYVGHLVTADNSDGEVLYPVALPGTGRPSERMLGEVANRAALALVTEGQDKWAQQQGVVMMAPVERHIESVEMVGVARLLYRPRTARTLAFIAREDEWTEALDRLRRIEAGQPNPFMQRQEACNIKETSR